MGSHESVHVRTCRNACRSPLSVPGFPQCNKRNSSHWPTFASRRLPATKSSSRLPWAGSGTLSCVGPVPVSEAPQTSVMPWSACVSVVEVLGFSRHPLEGRPSIAQPKTGAAPSTSPGKQPEQRQHMLLPKAFTAASGKVSTPATGTNMIGHERRSLIEAVLPV